MEDKKTKFGDRQQFYFSGIAAVCRPIHNFRCVNRTPTDRDYVLTLKNNGKPILSRLIKLYEYLANNVCEGETLSIENDCFVITDKEYRFSFSVEWYKNACEGLTFNNNEPNIKMLYRAGVEAYVTVTRHGYVGMEITEDESMQKPELIEQFPNPADRFVYILKQKRKLLK